MNWYKVRYQIGKQIFAEDISAWESDDARSKFWDNVHKNALPSNNCLHILSINRI
jgi:hypothetical protein